MKREQLQEYRGIAIVGGLCLVTMVVLPAIALGIGGSLALTGRSLVTIGVVVTVVMIGGWLVHRGMTRDT